jgi:hypothetical protein
MRRITTMALVAGLATAMSSAAGAQDMPPMPKPGPEHAVLAMDTGTWDAVITLAGPPGAPAMTSKGVEVATIGCGGLCLITDFKGEIMPGVAFHGHGTTAYDSVAKKYVGSWSDSMSVGMATTDATYDAASKKLTGTMTARDMTGNLSTNRTTTEYTDADHRVMTMFMAMPDGTQVQAMTISYTRRK